MKKTLVTIAAVITTSVAFAQGTVNFANATSAYGTATPSHLVTWAASASAFNSALIAGSLVSSNFGGVIIPGLKAQLYYGASTISDVQSLTAVTTAPANFRSSTSANAGSWLGGTRSLGTSAFASTVNLLVVVWDTAFASDGLAAIAMGGSYAGLLGSSGIFTYVVPDPATLPAPTAFLMANQNPFTVGVVPEPASFALAGLGALSLFLFRRRK